MNILGESFVDYVDKQVDVRQEKYAKGLGSNRDTEDITFMNSKTAFARLMSSVEVDSKSNYTYVNNLGLGNLDLAKQYVLFAGTSISGLPSLQRSGIERDGAYGLGDFEMGARPMPGITSVDVKTDGDGFTNSATIKVKAYNRNQLEIIDALYLRLGYYMLLEWGNVIYWDNNGKLVNDPHDNSLQDYFFNPSNKKINNVLENIRDKRTKSCGNYDALFGRVLNFNWTYAADGTFDITINLRSIGDIIEGLKINSQKTITRSVPIAGSGSPPLELYKNKNAIGSLYYEVVDKIFADSGSYFVEPPGSPTNIGDKSFFKDFIPGAPNYQYYVKFDRFLAELQNSYVLLFNGDKSLKIDFEKGKNLIPINELTISVDPSVCIVSRTDTINPKALFVGATNVPATSFVWDFYNFLDPFVFNAGSSVKALYGDLMNVYLNFDFLLKKLDDITDAKTNRASFKRYLNEVLIEVSRALGSANQLQIFIDSETNTVKIIDKNPYPYRDELLAKVKSKQNPPTEFNITGYYNNKTGATNTTSFIKNLSIQTTIPPEFATIISIGAAANKKVVGEDSTAFSKLNAGLSTRFAETVTDGYEKITVTTPDETPNSLITSAASYIKYCVAGSAGLAWNINDFSTNKSILANLILYVNKAKSKEDEKSARSTSSPTSGFIPVNVSLTMDGLSGMKIFQKFTIDTTYLPSNYPSAVEILIKGISHKIQNNIWETTVDSLIVGKSNVTTNSNNKVASRGVVSTGTSCVDPYKDDNLNKGWIGKKQPLFTTRVDPIIEGPKLSAVHGKILAASVLATMYLEQGYKGFNWNIGGFDITSGGWSFNPALHNGYVVAREGGTNLCKAYVSFISFETFTAQIISRFISKGFSTITTGDQFAPLYYKKWNGYGARALKPAGISMADWDKQILKKAKDEWNKVFTYL